METNKIKTTRGKINPEIVALKLEQLAAKIRQSQTLTGTVQTTPYDSTLSVTNGNTILNLSTIQL